MFYAKIAIVHVVTFICNLQCTASS